MRFEASGLYQIVAAAASYVSPSTRAEKQIVVLHAPGRPSTGSIVKASVAIPVLLNWKIERPSAPTAQKTPRRASYAMALIPSIPTGAGDEVIGMLIGPVATLVAHRVPHADGTSIRCRIPPFLSA